MFKASAEASSSSNGSVGRAHFSFSSSFRWAKQMRRAWLALAAAAVGAASRHLKAVREAAAAARLLYFDGPSHEN